VSLRTTLTIYQATTTKTNSSKQESNDSIMANSLIFPAALL
jgi:hypothetical protein